MTTEAPTTDTVAMTTKAPTTSITVSFTLEDIPPDFLCIGGNEVGLINTSVQFQYRSISITSVIGDWITLDALPVNKTSDVTHNWSLMALWEVFSSDYCNWSMVEEDTTAGMYNLVLKLAYSMIIASEFLQ